MSLPDKDGFLNELPPPVRDAIKKLPSGYFLTVNSGDHMFTVHDPERDIGRFYMQESLEILDEERRAGRGERIILCCRLRIARFKREYPNGRKVIPAHQDLQLFIISCLIMWHAGVRDYPGDGVQYGRVEDYIIAERKKTIDLGKQILDSVPSPTKETLILVIILFLAFCS